MPLKTYSILSYIKHWWNAKPRKGHHIHSPFVYDLVDSIFNQKEAYYVFSKIEKRREQLLKNKTIITVNDLGAGSRELSSNHRIIKDIARFSLASPKESQFIFRLINRFQPSTLVELGTSLGITSTYMASVNKQSKLYTFEGCSEIAKIAEQTFRQVRLNNIELIIGNFDDTLAPQLKEISPIDFALIDGNHRYEPTMRYFNQLLNKAHSNSIFVFDDIYWSKEMYRAWQDIIKHPKITLSLDLYHMGIVFFRTENTKQDFKIRW